MPASIGDRRCIKAGELRLQLIPRGALHRGSALQLGSVVVLKAEYTHVREVDPLPDFPDDVFTSSLIIKY